MAIKHKSWQLQEIAEKERRRNNKSQRAQAELDKGRAGSNLGMRRDFQRKQQTKADRERANARALDNRQTYRREEGERKNKQALIYSHKKRADKSGNSNH